MSLSKEESRSWGTWEIEIKCIQPVPVSRQKVKVLVLFFFFFFWADNNNETDKSSQTNKRVILLWEERNDLIDSQVHLTAIKLKVKRRRKEEAARLTSTAATLSPLNISDWAAMSAAISAAGMASSASSLSGRKMENKNGDVADIVGRYLGKN